MNNWNNTPGSPYYTPALCRDCPNYRLGCCKKFDEEITDESQAEFCTYFGR